ncbi:MAG: hypothetical protein ACKVSF_14585 [Alphaproteobacteria bacterium]
MSARRLHPFRLWGGALFGILAATAVCLATPHGARAGETQKSLTTQDKARQLREASEARAARNLGYPTIFPSDPPPPADYYALGQMMARLTALMEGMGGTPGLPMSRPGGSAAGLGANMVAVPPPGYGPEGPTEKSVRVILEYRLMLAGNPRLQIGSVKDRGETILASVVTADGSLVEEYDVNKTTGAWLPVRKGK